MYLATKRIDFCYGHRLLDYDGVCKHPHGHNAIAEIDVRTDRLDSRNMVADFSDIKRLVKGWIDRELDHKMILRHDDPLVEPLRALGEPMYLLESNPTVERIAKLIYDKGREQGLDIVTVRVWETPTSFATYGEAIADPIFRLQAEGSLFLEGQLVGEIEERRCVGILAARPGDRDRETEDQLLVAEVPSAAQSRRQRERLARAPCRPPSATRRR